MHRAHFELQGLVALLTLPCVDIHDTRHGQLLLIEASILQDAWLAGLGGEDNAIKSVRYLLSHKAALTAKGRNGLLAAQAVVSCFGLRLLMCV